MAITKKTQKALTVLAKVISDPKLKIGEQAALIHLYEVASGYRKR